MARNSAIKNGIGMLGFFGRRQKKKVHVGAGGRHIKLGRKTI
jgi:hypothetical protein